MSKYVGRPVLSNGFLPSLVIAKAVGCVISFARVKNRPTIRRPFSEYVIRRHLKPGRAWFCRKIVIRDAGNPGAHNGTDHDQVPFCMIPHNAAVTAGGGRRATVLLFIAYSNGAVDSFCSSPQSPQIDANSRIWKLSHHSGREYGILASPSFHIGGRSLRAALSLWCGR